MRFRFPGHANYPNSHEFGYGIVTCTVQLGVTTFSAEIECREDLSQKQVSVARRLSPRQRGNQPIDVVLVDIGVRGDSQTTAAATQRNVVIQALAAQLVGIPARYVK